MKFSSILSTSVALALTAAASNAENGPVKKTHMTMTLDWKYNCTPELLPLKREFTLEDYPNKEALVSTVKEVDAFASKGEYGLALLQWYNVTDYSNSNKTLMQDVISDIQFVGSQPGSVPGLKCLQTAIKNSPTVTNETQQIINALDKKTNNATSSTNEAKAFALQPDTPQCSEKDTALAQDCMQALMQLDNLTLDSTAQQQLQHGNCFVVLKAANNDVSIDEIKQQALALIKECSPNVAGTTLQKFGRVCLSNRETAC